ncbi:MAG: hypothetical protein CVU31_12720 [Betaproteobacteria bacterium HGW-Betaproteobacteria-4]|jgi:hypothetical protein|nr:MAG: hypothetical protein CVU31_12720 [Betaproteobacteria bacterium HGW-Betaproteobacteria-4]
MRITVFPSRILALFALSACLTAASASEPASAPKALQLHWEVAIADSRERPSQQLPARVLRTGNGELIAAGNRIVPLNRRGPGEMTSLDTKAVVLDAALDSQDKLWLGGRINQRAFFPGADTADAYLGKFSRNGQKLAEFVFGGRSWRQIVALHPRRDGGVLVTGPIERSSKENGSWLASISDQGKIAWEKTIGLPSNSAIAEGRDGNIAFVGLSNAHSSGHAAEMEAVFWLFDPQGKVLSEQPIRPGIKAHRSMRFERVAIEPSADGYFVLVHWANPSDDKPLDVAKLSPSGQIQWNVSLRHTAVPWAGRAAVWKKCEPRQAVLENGDLLVTCSVEGEIVLSRLDGKTGAEKIQKVALPSCHERRPAVVTPVPVQKDFVLLFGSRPGNNVATSCSWLADWRSAR